MTYPARGGLDWGQMKGVLSEVRGSTPLGGLYTILATDITLSSLYRSWSLTIEHCRLPVLWSLSRTSFCLADMHRENGTRDQCSPCGLRCTV